MSVGAGDAVAGYVLSADALPWGRLDEFEGPEYRRLIAEVTLDDGSVVEGAVYLLDRSSGTDISS